MPLESKWICRIIIWRPRSKLIWGWVATTIRMMIWPIGPTNQLSMLIIRKSILWRIFSICLRIKLNSTFTRSSIRLASRRTKTSSNMSRFIDKRLRQGSQNIWLFKWSTCRRRFFTKWLMERSDCFRWSMQLYRTKWETLPTPSRLRCRNKKCWMRSWRILSTRLRRKVSIRRRYKDLWLRYWIVNWSQQVCRTVPSRCSTSL